MFAHKVVPELATLTDREVRETQSIELWYKIVGNVLYVPPEKYIRFHPREAIKYCEYLEGFVHVNLQQLSDPHAWDIPYRVLYTEDECIAAIKSIMASCCTYVTCDIECSHTGWFNQKMLLLGLKSDMDDCVYEIAYFSNAVIYMLNDLFASPQIKFVWHNGKFDIGRLHFVCGVKARVDEDTMLLHYVGINEQKGTHGLKDLAEIYLAAPRWDDELERIKREEARRLRIPQSDFTYDLIPANVLAPYNACDIAATEKLLFLFKKLARPECAPAYANLILGSNAYARVEENGFYIDQPYLNQIHIELQEQIIEAEDAVELVARRYWDPVQYKRETGAKSLPKQYFNHRSPAQLKWLLKQVTGVALESADAEALDALYEEYPEVDFLQALMQLRSLNKMLDTYVTGIRKATCVDGRVRPSFNLHGTVTGRLSCSEPNLQNVPRDAYIKNIFCAFPGRVLVQLDYSQAELRCLAYLSKDPWLTEVFASGADLHNRVAAEMYGEGFTKEQRVRAKTLNFGIAYGLKPKSVMDKFNVSFSEASNIIAKWFKPMPLVKAWLDAQRTNVLKGVPYVTEFGRTRHYVITDDNRSGIQNEAVNFPVSSIATDLTMCSLIKIQCLIEESKYAGRIFIVNNVHDSIVFECDDDKEIVQWLVGIGCEVMRCMPFEKLPNCNVPFRADAEVGYSWGKLMSVEEYMAR